MRIPTSDNLFYDVPHILWREHFVSHCWNRSKLFIRRVMSNFSWTLCFYSTVASLYRMLNWKCVRIFHCNLTMKLHTSEPAARTILTSVFCRIYGVSQKTLLLWFRLYRKKNSRRHRHNIRLEIHSPKVPVI